MSLGSIPERNGRNGATMALAPQDTLQLVVLGQDREHKQ